ncbi:MAG TPA: hypothetical protein VGE38_15010 [Nocardioides sp.]|uniref:hypothetical protein n=1 Tax=Nocardioides sp. TaxID=35761 RepID=UPI002ED976E3
MPLGRTLLSTARHWSTASQLRARNNAMAALATLAQRRAEREDVESFLAQLQAQLPTRLPAVLPLSTLRSAGAPSDTGTEAPPSREADRADRAARSS